MTPPGRTTRASSTMWAGSSTYRTRYVNVARRRSGPRNGSASAVPSASWMRSERGRPAPRARAPTPASRRSVRARPRGSRAEDELDRDRRRPRGDVEHLVLRAAVDPRDEEARRRGSCPSESRRLQRSVSSRAERREELTSAARSSAIRGATRPSLSWPRRPREELDRIAVRARFVRRAGDQQLSGVVPSRAEPDFYNWYDTESLRALDPQYVSSVDSGNLAGHLIALANACQDWCETPLEDAKRLAGIVDALSLVREEVEALRDRRRTETVTWRQLDESVAHLFAQACSAPLDGETLAGRLAALAGPAEILVDLASAFAIERGEDASDILFWAQAVCRSVASHQRDLASSDDLSARLSAIGRAAREMAFAMEFGFLLNEERLLLSVGYVVRDGALDESSYDLLASEARLASFIAIAKGDLPPRHWFRLGHGVTHVRGGAALLSWSGSMFEYLMPSLIMHAPAESIIGRTNRAIVRRQIDYAKALATPWGISESAYNARDLQLTYQYSNFGIPGLGLKRGLSEDAVIAPYATALAAIVDPAAAARNFTRLATEGARGRFGYYEALDFTPRRLSDGQKVAIVRAFMAHHQGMTVVAIADALLGGMMRERFHAEPIVRAAELLLHERMPREIAAAPSWASDTKPRQEDPRARDDRRLAARPTRMPRLLPRSSSPTAATASC